MNHKSKLQILHFQVEEMRLCAYLKYITKVLPLPMLDTLPGSPAFVAGLMNLGGKCVPVIDLRMRLGLRRDEDISINSPLLLCEYGEASAAIIVDDISGIVETDSQELQASPEFAQGISLVLGAIAINDKLALLLDVEALLQKDLGLAGASYG